MGRLNPHRLGLVLAPLLGGWHLLWALLVALGWAQPVIDFIFWIHFIKPIYVIEPFDIERSVILIAVTSSIGYAGGYCLGLLWNWIGGGSSATPLPIQGTRRTADR